MATENTNDHGEENKEPLFKNSSGDSSAVPRSDLARQEDNAPEGTNQSSGALAPAEKGLYSAAESLLPPQARLAGMALKILTALRTNRKAQAGSVAGALVGGFIIFGGFFLGTYEATALTEQMIGPANKLANSALGDRRSKSFSKVVHQLKNGKLTDRFDNDKFTRKMAQRGFITDFDANKKLTKLEYEVKDAKGRTIATKSFDFNKNYSDAHKEFFSSDPAGRRMFAEFQIATGGTAPTWKGKAATKLWAKYKISFYNWLDRSPSDKAKNSRQKFADIWRHADETEQEYARRAGNDPRPKDANGNPIGDSYDTSEVADQAQEYADELKNNPAAGDEIIQGSDSAVASEASNVIRESEKGGSFSFGDAMDGAGKAVSAKGVIGAISVTDQINKGCRVKGLINFAQYFKNTGQAVQLAKFTARYMTAGHHQKAGIVSKEGFPLYMQYLHSKNPANGKSYTSAGGFQNVVLGEKNARPSSVNSSRYSSGRSDEGMLADLQGHLNNGAVGSVLSEGNCEFTNNTFVQIGGVALGGVVAFFSGGTVTAGQVAVSAGLSIAGEIAFQIVSVMVVKSAAGLVMNGLENGEQAGDAMASGLGSLKTMNSGANGLRPLKNSEVAMLERAAESQYEVELATQGVFERYFDVHNHSSVANKLAIAIPNNNLSSIAVGASSTASSIFQPTKIFSSLFGAFNGNDAAFAANTTCNDPEIKKNDIKTDVMCNIEVASAPDIDLDRAEKNLHSNGDIDQEGNPISDEFKNYIEECHSGRTGLLYREIKSTDEESLKNGKINPNDASNCAKNGPTFKNGRSYPEGQFIVYTAWYGYQSDLANLEEHVNETYGEEGGQAADSESGGSSIGDANLKKTVTVKTPGKFITMPSKYSCSGRTTKIDSRIAASLAYLLTTYSMCVDDGLASGHKSHGAGLGVDIRPKDQSKQGSKTEWKNTVEKAARDMGWWGDGADEPKSQSGCAKYSGYGQCVGGNREIPTWIRWIGYNGDVDHGDPWHIFGGSYAHIHIGWASPNGGDAVSPGVISNPIPAVYTFPAPVPDDLKGLIE